MLDMWKNQQAARQCSDPSGMRWTSEFIHWCLYMIGNTGYAQFDKLREIMYLPSDRQLRRYRNRFVQTSPRLSPCLVRVLL